MGYQSASVQLWRRQERRQRCTYTHTHTHTHIYTCAHMHACAYTHVHIYTYAHKHIYIHVHMHTCMQTHTHPHTERAHTHKHTQARCGGPLSRPLVSTANPYPAWSSHVTPEVHSSQSELNASLSQQPQVTQRPTNQMAPSNVV